MTERSYPFPAQPVSEAEWRDLYAYIAGSGVVDGRDGELALAEAAPVPLLSVVLATGYAMVGGFWYHNDAALTLAITGNASGLTRIDVVVLRRDLDTNSVVAAVVQGTPGAGVPALESDPFDTIYEEPLWEVTVASGTAQIFNASLRDVRHFTDTAQVLLEQLADKPVVRLATAAAMAASTRVGNRRTANANGAMANIDGTAPAVGDRVLDKDNATGADRGIWIVRDLGSVSTPWVMDRADDADTSAKVKGGLWVRVAAGSTLADTGWLLTTDDPIVLNTTALTFTRFPGATVAAPGLTWAGSAVAEVLSTASVPTDIVTVSGLNIPAGSPFRVVLSWRKIGTANTLLLGLKINSTVCMEASNTPVTGVSAAAGRGMVVFDVAPATANYAAVLGNWVMAGSNGGAMYGDFLARPAATVTSITIRGKANSGDQFGVADVQVYALATS